MKTTITINTDTAYQALVFIKKLAEKLPGRINEIDEYIESDEVVTDTISKVYGSLKLMIEPDDKE